MPLAMGGFGREVREAMTARAEHLAQEGLRAPAGPARHPAARSARTRCVGASWTQLAREALGRDGPAAHEGRRRRACRGHLSPAPHALVRPLRHDRQRPRLPARALVADPREETRPACLRRRPRMMAASSGASDGSGDWGSRRGCKSTPQSRCQTARAWSAFQSQPTLPVHQTFVA